MNHVKRTFASILLIIVAAVTTACGADDPEKLIASTKAFLAKEDAKSAIIQIKTALQEDPDNAEARFLHGKALLLGGDPAAAVIELRKALELRHSQDAVVPELVRALYADGKYQLLLDEFGQTTLSDARAQADLLATLAVSHGSLGQRDLALRAIANSLRLVPDYGPAKIFEARLQADGGDLPGALRAADAQIQRDPRSPEAWQLKGDLLNYGQRDVEGALAAYRQALEVKQNFVPAHSATLSLLIAKQDVAAARKQLAQLNQVLPSHPQTAYFAGNIELLDKNVDKARGIAQALLRVAPKNALVLQLAGAIEFEKRSYLQAETHLTRALQANPEQGTARQMLALTYLRLTQPAKALASLQPLLEKPDPASSTYALAAEAHLQAGDLQAAEASLARAAEIDPSDKRTQTALAVSRVLKGNAEEGISTLRELAANDQGTTADLPLISFMVRNKDFSGALQAIDALEKKAPESPVAANLRARVMMQQGKVEQARQGFEQALKLQPSFYPATSALAQMALLDGKPDEAQRLVDEALKADPKSTPALLTSARLMASRGAPREEIIAVFTGAIQQGGNDPAPRLALINFHLASRDFKAALEVAQSAATSLPDNVEILDALGRAQAATGDTNQAISTFSKLSQILPRSPLPNLRLADVQWAGGKREAAMQSLKRALSVAPDNLQAQRAMVDAYLADNNTAQAAAVAREVQKQRPAQDIGFLMEGSIAASRQQWDQALTIYRQGLAAAPDSTELATRIHVALVTTKKQAAADQHAVDWLKSHPADAAFRSYLGDTALANRQLAVAEARYREVLELQPDNALALNNLAWLLATTKKPGAVVVARKAAVLLPDRPAIMNTLAMALASEGQTAEAVRVMKQAVALQDRNPQLRLELARLLVQVGDKSAAKVELEALAALGTKFPMHNEVSKMLKTL